MRIRKTIALAAVIAGGAAGAGYAAIPSSDGILSACKKPDGSIRLIDREAGQTCAKGAELVEWSEKGPAGPAGPQGEPGPAGPQGAPGPADPIAGAHLDRFGTATGNAQAADGEPCTLGEIRLTASTTKTAGGVPARGQLLPINQHTALFALIQNTYGGNGQSTFALPDLRAITPDHMTYSICTEGTWPA
jgi:hypothetical protein